MMRNMFLVRMLEYLQIIGEDIATSRWQVRRGACAMGVWVGDWAENYGTLRGLLRVIDVAESSEETRLFVQSTRLRTEIFRE